MIQGHSPWSDSSASSSASAGVVTEPCHQMAGKSLRFSGRTENWESWFDKSTHWYGAWRSWSGNEGDVKARFSLVVFCCLGRWLQDPWSSHRGQERSWWSSSAYSGTSAGWNAFDVRQSQVLHVGVVLRCVCESEVSLCCMWLGLISTVIDRVW